MTIPIWYNKIPFLIQRHGNALKPKMKTPVNRKKNTGKNMNQEWPQFRYFTSDNPGKGVIRDSTRTIAGSNESKDVDQEEVGRRRQKAEYEKKAALQSRRYWSRWKEIAHQKDPAELIWRRFHIDSYGEGAGEITVTTSPRSTKRSMI